MPVTKFQSGFPADPGQLRNKVAGNIPSYALLLTGGPASLVPVTEAERAYFAAVSEDDPPSNATILYTVLQYPARLKAQLRENLKRQNVQVIDQVEVTPAELEKIYANAQVQTKSNTADVDYERGRDAVRGLLARAVADTASDIHIVRRSRTARVSFRIDGRIVPHAEWSDQCGRPDLPVHLRSHGIRSGSDVESA